MSYKILIIEDEQLAYNRLFKQIVELDGTVQIQPQVYSIATALEWFATNKQPDLLFLDIHLSDGSSFEIFKHVSINCPIIFTTAYDEYAVEAFKYNSIHYLLKPINIDDLKASYEKFKQYHYTQETLKNLKPKVQEKKYLVKLGNKYLNIDINDVHSFYAKDKLNFIFTNQNQNYPIDISLDKLQEELDETIFFRVNRHLISKREYITSFATKEKSKLELQIIPAPPVPTNVSSERSAEFKKWWKNI